MKADSHVWNATQSKDERVAQLLVMRGGQGEQVTELPSGDIGAVLKLAETLTGDTLTRKSTPSSLAPITLSRAGLLRLGRAQNARRPG